MCLQGQVFFSFKADKKISMLGSLKWCLFSCRKTGGLVLEYEFYVTMHECEAGEFH
jgi:hypothetical protein